MRMHDFRQTLTEFARQARQGGITNSSGEGAALADLAEQLEARISRGQALNEIKADSTVSLAALCPCCGRVY